MSRLLALALLALALILPAAADAATLGTTAVYTPTISNQNGVAQVYRFTAQSSGTIDRVSVYLDGANTASAVELGLYTGSASTAVTRRARCVINSPQAGAWNRCSVTAYAVTADTPWYRARRGQHMSGSRCCSTACSRRPRRAEPGAVAVRRAKPD
jgi:hypothetical protein